MNEALRPSGPCRTREGEDLIDLGGAPRALGARRLERAAQAAERAVAGEPFQLRFEPIEEDDPVREPRMLAAERATRDGIHPCEVGRFEQRSEQMTAGETA